MPGEPSSRRRHAALEFFTIALDRIRSRSSPTCNTGYSGGMEGATTIFYGEKGSLGPGAGGPQSRISGWQLRHRARLGRCVASGGSPPISRCSTRTTTDAGVRRRPATQPRHGARSRTRAARHAGHPSQPRRHGGGDRQLVYQKGGWTLHMLRQEIGVDAFWTHRDYYRTCRDGNASMTIYARPCEPRAAKTRLVLRSVVRRQACHPSKARGVHEQNVVEVTLTQKQPMPFRLRPKSASDGSSDTPGSSASTCVRRDRHSHGRSRPPPNPSCSIRT